MQGDLPNGSCGECIKYIKGGKMKKIYSLGAVLIVLFAMTMSSTAMEKQTNGNPNPGVLPPNSKPHGSTYGEWSANWWQWVLSMPINKNPSWDTANCAEGQSSNVWFLAGTFVPGKVTRTCTVPAGKSLFFPIVNTVWISTDDGDTLEIARAETKAYIDQTTLLEVSIDGVPLENLQNYRAVSPPFDSNLIFGEPVVTYSPSISDGYWLMLAPLSAGEHTISILGKINPDFVVDVTYQLTVM
jgi:hypothetical protein